MMVGLVLGFRWGLPGLGGPTALRPAAADFTMDPTSAIVMLSCIYWVRCSAAHHLDPVQYSGEAWSVATTSTVIRWRKQGRAAEALTAAFTSSFIVPWWRCC